ncbi:classes i and ii family protein [Stylonychia lemnae]|uniref:Classes i and ii family protein n=1 Tax=Stylonychia lemnae TaxID=5949 RepID=A0A078ANC2_STYLE|nr:classes i and ii family protein [Stylonychia lemnae]|eukprot:CDW83669.1 classes i and ii family protein [Stylonychia lemnae]
MEQAQHSFPHRVDDNTAVWAEFKDLTERYSCISLGEGAPAANPPQFLVDELMKAIQEGHNQYSRTFGHPILVQSVAEYYGKKLGQEINPLTQVIVSAGAYNVIVNALLALIRPNEGEEVLVFEPGWPCYIDLVQFAGGIYRPLCLQQKDGKWHFDAEQFKNSLNNNTKLFIFNNAQNPTGKIFTREELDEMSKILENYPNVIVLSDDVYEFLTYDGTQFTGFASIGDNFKKTLSIYCPGKMMCATGWQVGWAVGPEKLIKPVSLISTTQIYCANTPVQVAYGRALPQVDKPGYKGELSFVEHIRQEFQEVRDYMFKELSEGFDLPVEPLRSESGYFILLDISKCKELIPERYLKSHQFEELKEGQDPLKVNEVFMSDGSVPLDLAFCRWIAVERGVIMMPCSLFYHKESPYRLDQHVRLVICKGLDHSIKAIERLKSKRQ